MLPEFIVFKKKQIFFFFKEGPSTAYLRVSLRFFFFFKRPQGSQQRILNNSHGKMHPESLKSIKPLALYSTFD